jgi:tetratricopeptide (TPR) repeat protein
VQIRHKSDVIPSFKDLDTVSLKKSTVSFCLFVSLCISSVQAEISADANAAFDQQRWEDAIALLQAQERDAEGERLLALAYYESQDIDAALPAIRAALENSPADIALNQALLEILIADRLYAEAATVNEVLAESGLETEAQFGRARIAAAQGDTRTATGVLDGLVDSAEPELAQESANLLIELLIASDEAGRAFEVAQRAIARDPDFRSTHSVSVNCSRWTILPGAFAIS